MSKLLSQLLLEIMHMSGQIPIYKVVKLEMMHLLEWDLQSDKEHLYKELLQLALLSLKALKLNKEKFGLDLPQNT
jgi:hypothetical protein